MAKIENIDIVGAVQDFYMSYAVSTITDRMFPFIDGLKPVQRRGLYAMKKLGLVNEKITKSANVVGKTMGEYHPHGDASIYDALRHMSDYYEGINAPLVHGEGLGKKWADGSVPAAHMRYTEMGLSDLASEVYFDDINKNAVEMIPNYLATDTEPLLLPVKFPTIITNTTRAVACGFSSYLPPYTLENVCNATIGLLNGTITTAEQLARALGVPDFSTGGFVHTSQKQLIDLCTTGESRGTVLTSKYVMSKNNVMKITEIPFNTTIDRIISQIEKLVENGTVQGITRVCNGVGDLDMGIDIYLKRGIDPAEMFKVLCSCTDIQKKISFSVKFVQHQEESDGFTRFNLIECGVKELLENYWIPWRIKTKRRVYQFDLDKLKKEEMQIGAWQKIKGRTAEYLDIMSKNKKKDAVAQHIALFCLTDEEESYLCDHRASSYTIDEVEKQLSKLDENLRKQKQLIELLTNDFLVKQEIITELSEISKKYASKLPRKTEVKGLHEVIKIDKKERDKISDVVVYVGLTKNGYLKKADTVNETYSFSSKLNATDELKEIFQIRNNDSLLVFSTWGYVYKVPVNNIENGTKTKFRDMVWHLVDKDPEDKGEIFKAIPAGDYSSEFNIIYNIGAARKVKARQFKARKVYREAFPGYNSDVAFLTKEDEVLAITNQMRATFIDLRALGLSEKYDNKSMTKPLPPMKKGEKIQAIILGSEIANLDNVRGKFALAWVPVSRQDLQRNEQPTGPNLVPVTEASYENEEMVEVLSSDSPTAEELLDANRLELLLSSGDEDFEDFDRDYIDPDEDEED